MKDEKWLVYIIVAFTSITTVLLLADGTFLGFVRGVVAAVILDGLIIYWDKKRVTLKNKRQRDLSGAMMWAGVGIMLTFAAGYGVEVFAPVDAKRNVDIFGFAFAITLTEFILMLAASIMGAWVVLTLGVILYMRGIDPDIIADLDKVKAEEEAEQERRHVEREAYKTAMNVTAKTVGTEKALRAFRENLKATGYYTDYEIEQMSQQAEAEINIARTGGIVNPPANVNRYQAETGNFTPPSTPAR